MTILDQNGNVVLDITARAGAPPASGGVLLTPGPYTIKFSAQWGEDDSSPALTYLVQGNVLSDPIGVVIHNPTHKPIYVAPTQSPVPYWYPGGTQSAIPYQWRPGLVLFPDGTAASAPQNIQASRSSLSWGAPAQLLPNDHVASYDVTITDSNGNTDPFTVNSPSTSLDLSRLLAPGAYTATVYAVDSQGFAGAISASASFTITPAGGSAVGGTPGAPTNPATASPDASGPTSVSSTPTKKSAASTTKTHSSTAGSRRAGHRHAKLIRHASQPRHHAAGRLVHRPIA
jgi:hypothetical protein